MQQTFVLRFKKLHKTAKHNKTCAIRRQNLCHKAAKVCTTGKFFFLQNTAKLPPKGSKTCAIRQQKFVLRDQKFFPAHKKYHFCTAKKQLAHFLILYAYFSALGTLSHTFPYFLSF